MEVQYVITRFPDLKDVIVFARFDDGKCVGLETQRQDSMLGNIYVGRVENVVKNLNCAFIEVQKGVRCYYSIPRERRHLFLNPKNNEAVNNGDLMLVQVSREAAKTKPATATCQLSLADKYIVLSSDVQGVHISEKNRKNEKCASFRQKLLKTFLLNAFDDACADGFNGGIQRQNLSESQYRLGSYGFIIRTNAALANEEELLEQARRLVRQFFEILKKAMYGSAFSCVHTAEAAYLGSLKSVSACQLREIVTDLPDACRYMSQHLPDADKNKIRLYDDSLLPLHKLYDIGRELDEALKKRVWLKCGGYLVIEQTEALTVIDVNSGKCVSKKQGSEAKENTAKTVNMDAACEIARQLRLRNLSGIILVDFINMGQEQNVTELMSFLKGLLKQDPGEAAVVDITKLGLVELTRKRSGKCLSEQVAELGGWHGAV